MTNGRYQVRMLTGLLPMLFLATQANAWGPLGHKAVALMAQERLEPGALHAVQEILGGDVGLDQIANCADGMLHTKGTYDCAGILAIPLDKGKKTRPWHYINIRLESDAAPEYLPAYCPNGTDCVVEQIRLQASYLGKPGATLQEKRMESSRTRPRSPFTGGAAAGAFWA